MEMLKQDWKWIRCDFWVWNLLIIGVSMTCWSRRSIYSTKMNTQEQWRRVADNAQIRGVLNTDMCEGDI